MHLPRDASALRLLLLSALAISPVLTAQPPPAAQSAAARWCGETATYDDLTGMLKEPFGKILGGVAEVELTIFSQEKYDPSRGRAGAPNGQFCFSSAAVAELWVSVTGEVRISGHEYDYPESGGGMGGGQLDAGDLELLKSLIEKLPDDDHHVPPPADRVIVSVVRDGAVTVRLYDRTRLPDEIAEMIRMTGIRITFPEHVIAPSHSWTQSEAQQAGIVPGQFAGSWARNVGRTLAVNANGSMFTAEDHDKMNLRIYRSTGDATPPELVHTISEMGSESPLGRRLVWATNTYFSPDGQLLLVVTNRPEIQLFNTSTWQQVTDMSMIPAGATGYVPSPDWKLGLADMGANQALLWDSVSHRAISSLKLDDPLNWAVFSPDDRVLAFTTAKPGFDPLKLLRLNAETGDELPELWPAGWRSKINAAPLLWGDGRSLVAAWWSSDTGTGGLALWDSSTGRLLGTLEGRTAVPVLQGDSLLSFRSALRDDPGGVKEWTLDDVLWMTAK